MQFTLERSAFDQFRGDALGLRAEPGLDAAQIGCLIGEKRHIRERTESVVAHCYRQRSLAAAPAPWAVPLTNLKPLRGCLCGCPHKQGTDAWPLPPAEKP